MSTSTGTRPPCSNKSDSSPTRRYRFSESKPPAKLSIHASIDRLPHHERDIMQLMTRRELLAGTLAVASLPAKTAKVDRSRISAISDEIGKTPQASIDFAKQYDLQFLELRNVPGGKEYSFLPEDQVKEAAANFARNGIRISFMNSSLLKFAWPGTEPVRKRQETEEARAKRLQAESERFAHRMDDLKTAIRNCHILGVDLLRVFTGTRTAEPEKLHPRIVEVLGEMELVA